MTWMTYYKLFADTLLRFQDDHAALVDVVIAAFNDLGMKLPTLDSSDQLTDIDPFTVFGLFNKGLSNDNRLKIMKALGDCLGVNAPLPDDFNGIPVLHTINSIYYRYTDGVEQKTKNIKDLWALFVAGIHYADNPSSDAEERFILAYDIAREIKGNRAKLTMGLYWSRPNTFISLDSRNRWYITGPADLPEKLKTTFPKDNILPTGKDYLSLCRAFAEVLPSTKYKDIVSLSESAWFESEADNKREAMESMRNEKGSGLADENVDTVHYWVYAPGEGAHLWDECYTKGIMSLGWSEIGNLNQYPDKAAIKEACVQAYGEGSYTMSVHAIWQFAHEIKPGDIVFAKKGRHLIIGRGIVESDYMFDNSHPEHKNYRKVRWTDKGERPHPGNAVLKTLTDVTQYTDYVKQLCALYEDEDDIEDQETPIVRKIPLYSIDDFFKEVFMDEDEYESLVTLLRTDLNVILRGAPGVGKTYTAKRIAYSMMGEKDPSRIMMVQFHQSYSYEEFIMGIRPNENGTFITRPGVFYNFCKRAEIDSDREYFFIIDEINRGNLSKIFGELFMLIEADKRDNGVQLLYSDEKFSVPHNVIIIGMMNTADRSLALMDYALKRRFGHFDMVPAFYRESFKAYQAEKKNPKYDRLVDCIMRINQTIREDDGLGAGFEIGHSYVCTDKPVTDAWLRAVVEYHLRPLLEEYWFDNHAELESSIAALRSAIK